MICGYWLKSMPGIAFSEPPLWPDCTTRIGMSGRARSEHVGEPREQHSPLCGDGLTKVTNARDSVGATTDDHSIGGSSGVLTSPIFSRYTSVRNWLHVNA